MKTHLPPKPARPLRVLFIDDSKPDAELAKRALETAGFVIEADLVEDSSNFLEKIGSVSYDIILADYNLPGWNGLAAFESLRQSGKDIPFILVTGSMGEEAAVDCIKQGVSDYVLKDRLARLPVAVSRALESKALVEERNRTAQELWSSEAKLGLVFAQLPGVVWTTDRELRVQSLAGMGLPLIGWKADQVLRHTLYEVYQTNDRNAPPIAAHRRALVEKPAVYEDVRGKREFSVRVEPLRDPEGMVAGCISLAIDVTDQRRVEQQLRQTDKTL